VASDDPADLSASVTDTDSPSATDSADDSRREPVLDGRSRDSLFRDAIDLAPGYTPSWDPGDDAGTALVHLFAELARYATERLDRVPAKHRVAFFDRLGFDRAPPQAGRIPLTVTVSEGATENVRVPAGTRAVDEAKTVFETDAGFEATPARLTDVVSVDPAADRLYRHDEAVADGESFQPFAGRDRQAHVLSLGHADLLQQAPDAPVRVRLRVESDSESETEAVADFLADCLVWEWYGEATDPIRLDDPAPEGEPVEDWHVVEPTDTETDTDRWGEQVVSVELRPPGTLTETTVGDRTSRWLRATTNRNCDPGAVFDLALGPVTLAVGDRRAQDDATVPGETGTALGGGAVGRAPGALFANDVPLSDPTASDPVLPFGDHPRHRDTFAIASGDALTTPGATVTLSVTLANADTISADGAPSVSWEYWNGDAWTRLTLRDETDPDARRFTDSGTVVFDVPADLAETAVAGEDGHWIRARLVGGTYGSVAYVRTETSDTTETWTTKTDGVTPPTLSLLRIQYGKEERPDHLLAADNGEAPRDVSLALRERTRPFRRLPADGQTLALGFDRRLEDGPIQLLWSPTDRATPADFDPRLAWTYSRQSATDAGAGDAGVGGENTEWAVPDVADGTERLLTRGLLSVVFPDASDVVGLFGAARHWLRASVVEGEFETPPPATGPTDLPIRIDRIDAPRETVRLRNTGDRSLDISGYLLDVEHGNPAVDQHRALPGGTVIDAGGTLTVASGRISPGPADVWFDFRAPVLNDTVPDEVALLTPAGDPVAVGGGPVAGEEASGTTDRTDETGAATDAGDDSADEAGDDCGCGGHADCGCGGHADIDPCETTLPTESSVGEPTETPPVVEVLAVNAGWATNVESVSDEPLGGSDGTAAQTFTVASPPVVAESVWVDEGRTLTAGDRRDLLADRPEQIEVVGGSATGDTDPDAVWVRWTAVADFLGSGPDDRHYTVDRLTGEIQFGDGRRGRIPPRGRDGVRASYETGGGSAGNVPRGTVTKLESAIALVDEVTNPIAGDGGADAESTDSAVTRASRTLRDGDRAVTPVDFERVAATTTRKLARARCLPATDAAGARRAGFVTLIVVPASSARKPVPSASLRERVADRVADHAPTTVVTRDRLIVRGPAYVEATVAVRVVATLGVESVSAVERAVDDALSAYLHPLSGGESSEGWAFGTLPCPADLFAVAEGVGGVDHVADLTVTFHGDGTTTRVGDGDEVPGVSEDVLVFAGTHDVRASRASSGGVAGPETGAGDSPVADAGTGGGA
jgi:hypothetical protein